VLDFFIYKLFYKLWYGRFRRPIRKVFRRILKHRQKDRILFGPLRGYWFIDDGRLSYSLGIHELYIQYNLIHFKEI